MCCDDVRTPQAGMQTYFLIFENGIRLNDSEVLNTSWNDSESLKMDPKFENLKTFEILRFHNPKVFKILRFGNVDIEKTNMLSGRSIVQKFIFRLLILKGSTASFFEIYEVQYFENVGTPIFEDLISRFTNL